jgi:hypothetical protein
MRRPLIIVTLLLATCCAFASSPPHQQQPERPASSQAVSQKEQHIPAHPVPPLTLQRATTANHAISSSSKEKWWWDDPELWNGLVAAFTFCLVLVGIVQIVVYWKQKGVMERTLATANKSIDLARDEFNATYRPKLVARSVYITAAFVDRRIRLYFHLYNSGDVTATVDSFKFFAKVQDAQLVEFLKFTLDSEKPPFVIDVGEERRWETHADDSKVLFQYMDASNLHIWAAAGTDVFFEFRGDITFLDGAGKKRHCSFHRVYNFQTRRFMRVEDSEFEYSD